MFENWTMKEIYIRLGFLLIIVAGIQIYMFIYSDEMIIHFAILFVALFIALTMFHAINIKVKQNKKKKK